MNQGELIVEYLWIASTGFSRYILYRSKHISAVSNPQHFDREEAAMQFVELHNILHKILVFFGIPFLANSRRSMDDVVVHVLEWQRQHDAVSGSF